MTYCLPILRLILAVSDVNHAWHLASVHTIKCPYAWILGQSSEKYVIMEPNLTSDVV